jgi:hypothetical protein
VQRRGSELERGRELLLKAPIVTSEYDAGAELPAKIQEVVVVVDFTPRSEV